MSFLQLNGKISDLAVALIDKTLGGFVLTWVIMRTLCLLHKYCIGYVKTY